MKNIARPVRAYAIDAAPSRLPGLLASAAPRLSIVVLPFVNLSNDPEQEYLADALTEDLTTDLSRIEGMLVIARGTALTFKGKAADAKQVGRELGVHYVLDGSFRKLGPRIRVNAQLIDAETAAHLWAERFDRDAEDLFTVQDEIASRIAIELNLNLLAIEAAKPTKNPTALDYLLRARVVAMGSASAERYAEAIGLLERALALDPQSVLIRSRLAQQLTARVMAAMPADAADIERARALAEGALGASRAIRPRITRGRRCCGRSDTGRRRRRITMHVLLAIATLRLPMPTLRNAGCCQVRSTRRSHWPSGRSASVRAIPTSATFISGSVSRTCCNRATTRRSPGWRRRAPRRRRGCRLAFGLAPPMAWPATTIRLRTNSPKPVVFQPAIAIRASLACAPPATIRPRPGIGAYQRSAPCSRRLFLLACARPE